MPKVPVAEQNVRLRETNVPAPIQGQPVEAAYGGKVAEAQTRFGEQLQRTSAVVSDRLLEIQIRDDDQEVLARANDFSKQLQTTLTDDTPDGNDRPNGLLSRQMNQAKDIIPEYDEKVAKLQQNYSDSVAGPNQKVALDRIMQAHALSGRERVIQHESAEREKAYVEEVKGQTESAISTAAATDDPATLSVLMATSAGTMKTSLLHLGYDRVSAENGARKMAGAVIKSAFTAVLETDPRKAQKILEANGASIPADMRADLQQKLDGKLLVDQAQAMYAQLSGTMTADGFPDQAKMEEAIRNNTTLTPEKKEHFAAYVKSRAAEDRQQITRQRDTADREFTNEVNKAKQAGGKLDDAIKMVPSYAYDPTDHAAKEAYARKLYAGPQLTDPGQFIGLWEGIQNNIVSRKDIDNAFLGGYLKPDDWEALRKERFRMTASGDSPDEKDVKSRVTKFAAENIHNKKDRDSFLYSWQYGARGKPAAEQFTYAQDLMKSHDPKWWKPSKPEYKTQLGVIDADRTEMGSLYKMIGQEEVNAIGYGVTLTGKPKWGVADVNAFAKEFGGPEKILPGTPVHNAIQSLNRRRKLVNAENVKKVLAARPDGKF